MVGSVLDLFGVTVGIHVGFNLVPVRLAVVGFVGGIRVTVDYLIIKHKDHICILANRFDHRQSNT